MGGRQQLQWKSAGRYRGGVEGILEHSVGVSFRTLIISMFEIFPRLKGQGTGTLWMIVFGSRYLAKGKHQSSDPAGPQLHNSTGSCPHGGRATFYNLHNGVLQVRGGPT